MYDPHHLRRNDRRFFTRKGQVIQAKNISAPFTIERNKVGAYKEYILKNHLVSQDELGVVYLTGVSIYYNTLYQSTIPFNQFSYTNNPMTLDLGEGLHTIIKISQNSDSYTLALILTNSTTFSFTLPGWYAYYSSEDVPNVADYINIWFDKNDKHYFNIMLIQDDQHSSSDNQISKSSYYLPLPAPSG